MRKFYSVLFCIAALLTSCSERPQISEEPIILADFTPAQIPQIHGLYDNKRLSGYAETEIYEYNGVKIGRYEKGDSVIYQWCENCEPSATVGDTLVIVSCSAPFYKKNGDTLTGIYDQRRYLITIKTLNDLDFYYKGEIAQQSLIDGVLVLFEYADRIKAGNTFFDIKEYTAYPASPKLFSVMTRDYEFYKKVTLETKDFDLYIRKDSKGGYFEEKKGGIRLLLADFIYIESIK